MLAFFDRHLEILIPVILALTTIAGKLAMNYVNGRRNGTEKASKEAQTKKTEIEAAHMLIQDYQQAVTDLRDEVNQLSAERDLMRAELDQLQSEFQELRDTKDREIAELKSEIRSLKGQLTRERNLRKELEHRLDTSEAINGQASAAN